MSDVMRIWSLDYRPLSWRWWRELLDLRQHCRRVKWTWQRATRGWADCDVWGFDSYLAAVVAGGCEHLRHLATGYPVDSTPDEWDRDLREIVDGFRAHNNMHEVPDEYVTNDSTATLVGRVDLAALNERNDKLDAIRSRGFATFVRRFGNLWD